MGITAITPVHNRFFAISSMLRNQRFLHRAIKRYEFPSFVPNFFSVIYTAFPQKSPSCLLHVLDSPLDVLYFFAHFPVACHLLFDLRIRIHDGRVIAVAEALSDVFERQIEHLSA